ncbi:hypothetical protein LCGC14_2806150, partial [marine sediment metagenome]
MTVRWIEGFEARIHHTWQVETYGQDGTGGYSGAAMVSNVTGRKVGKALAANAASLFTTPKLVASPTDTWIIQFAWNKTEDTAVSGAPGFRLFRQASGEQLEIRVVTGVRSGCWALEVFRGAVSLGKTQDYPWGGPRTWMVFQIAVVIHTSAGSVNIKAWDINNASSTALNLTGINTADQGVNGMDQVQFAPASTSGATHRIDDIVIMDDAGSVNNAQTSVPFLVYGQLPLDDGPTTDWFPSTGSAHYLLLDEPSTSV